MNDALKSASILGLVGSALACSIVFGRAKFTDAWTLVVAAGLAAFTVGYVLWGLICSRSQPSPVRRGVLAGALTGLIAHPLAWYFAIVVNYLRGHSMFPGATPVEPVKGIVTSLVYAFFSIIITGWLTIPVGAVTGWLLARHTRL